MTADDIKRLDRLDDDLDWLRHNSTVTLTAHDIEDLENARIVALQVRNSLSARLRVETEEAPC